MVLDHTQPRLLLAVCNRGVFGLVRCNIHFSFTTDSSFDASDDAGRHAATTTTYYPTQSANSAVRASKRRRAHRSCFLRGSCVERVTSHIRASCVCGGGRARLILVDFYVGNTFWSCPIPGTLVCVGSRLLWPIIRTPYSKTAGSTTSDAPRAGYRVWRYTRYLFWVLGYNTDICLANS